MPETPISSSRLLRRVVSAFSSLLIAYIYGVIANAQDSPLILLAGVLGLVNPVAGIFSSIAIALTLFYLKSFFLLLVLLPSLLMLLGRGIRSWTSAAIIAIAAPMSVLYPKFSPIFLSFALLGSAFEDEIGASLNGILYFFVATSVSSILLPESSILSGLLYLPGGLAESITSSTIAGSIGEFYYKFASELLSNSILIEEFVLLVLSFYIVPIIRQNFGEKYIGLLAPIPIILNSFLINNHVSTGILYEILALTVTMVTVSATMSLKRTAVEERKQFVKEKKKIDELARRAIWHDRSKLVDIVFHDVKEKADTLRRLLTQGLRVLVLAPSLEDELLFVRFSLGSRHIPGNVVLSRRINGYNGIGYVVYIPPLSLRDRKRVFTMLFLSQGINVDELMVELIAENTENYSRSQILTLFRKIMKRLKEGNSISEAILDALGETRPDIKPEFYKMFEQIYEKYPVL